MPGDERRAARTASQDELVASVAGVLRGAGVAKRDRLCLALSGGVDSMVLLHVLCELQPPFGFALAAAHVHHGLSPNADDWLAFCERSCARLGVPFHGFRERVPRDDPSGVEAAARDARYGALARVDCEWLVLGHHQDDQAETVLFRLFRGAGVRGAGAMAAAEPGRPGRLRPLLAVRGRQVRAWAQARSLEWVEDESNTDLRYARNRVRHAFLPAVEDAFPGAVAALARGAENFREAGGLLDELAAHDVDGCGGVPMGYAALSRLSDARVRNLLRWLIRGMGHEAPARNRLVEAVRQLRAVGGSLPLQLDLGDVVCCAYRGAVWLEASFTGAPLAPAPWKGERELAWGLSRVRFDPVVALGIDRLRLDCASEVALVARWPGLAMRQGRGRPRRSFKNLCQEAGVPAWMRDRLPVLRVDGAAAWIAEIGVSADFACPPGAQGVLPVWDR